MTHRQELEHHRHSLGEIRSIMNSMKTLAYMETRKLTRFVAAQHAAVETIETVAADFVSFHPDTLPEVNETVSVYLLIGTERGFCGDFNQSLLQQLELTLQHQTHASPILITIGRKLHSLLEDDPRVAVHIDGASVVEEVAIVLNQIVEQLASLQAEHGLLTVYGLYHGSNEGIVMQKLLPPFQQYLNQPAQHRIAPMLNLSPNRFLIELTEQYLFAALYSMFYASLMAENHNRVTHLEGAVKQLDDKASDLTRQYNILRQEEIIEEIEVILLSASSLEEPR